MNKHFQGFNGFHSQILHGLLKVNSGHIFRQNLGGSTEALKNDQNSTEQMRDILGLGADCVFKSVNMGQLCLWPENEL